MLASKKEKQFIIASMKNLEIIQQEKYNLQKTV